MSERRIQWTDLGLPEVDDDKVRSRAAQTQAEPVIARPVDAIAFATPQGALSLIGCFDPLDGTVLEEGERAVVCMACNTGYHRTSWDFLAQRNNGACANCRKTSNFTVLLLAADGMAAVPQVDAYSAVVGLKELPEHIGRVVVFQGYVFAHQISSRSGTHFVKFHADRNPFNGFKLVIFEDDVHKWLDRGIDPASYTHRTIQVRGLLKDHPTFGLEILPKSPAQIRVVEVK